MIRKMLFEEKFLKSMLRMISTGSDYTRCGYAPPTIKVPGVIVSASGLGYVLLKPVFGLGEIFYMVNAVVHTVWKIKNVGTMYVRCTGSGYNHILTTCKVHNVLISRSS
jgi:hypothetical protein